MLKKNASHKINKIFISCSISMSPVNVLNLLCLGEEIKIIECRTVYVFIDLLTIRQTNVEFYFLIILLIKYESFCLRYFDNFQNYIPIT